MMDKLKVLNRNALKIIAIITMAMDHIAPVIFEAGSLWWTVFRFLGRLTFTIMIYLLADGFRYTRDLKKYISRMFIFSIISLFTFSFLETGSWLPVQIVPGKFENYAFSHFYIASIDKTVCISAFSVITNLLLALLTLAVWEKTNWKNPLKVLATAVMLVISMNCDWLYLPIILALNFYYLRDRKCAKWCVYILVSALCIFNVGLPANRLASAEYINVSFKLYRTGMLLLPVLIEVFYNGLPGKKTAFGKWFFYVFYPAHQVVIGLIAMFVNQ